MSLWGLLVVGNALAQNTSSGYDVPQEKHISEEERITRGDRTKAYRLLRATAISTQVNMPDTMLFENYLYGTAERRSLGVGYLGNANSPWVSHLFFDRPKHIDDFSFIYGYEGMLYTAANARYLDTKDPITLLRYHRNFASNSSETLLGGSLSANFGARINLGVEVDYLKANGFYTANRSKNANYRIFGSYRGERYRAFGFLANNYYVQNENGGITDYSYISNPSKYSNGRREIASLDVPTRIGANTLANRLRWGSLGLSHAYDLGYYHREIRELKPKQVRGDALDAARDSLQRDTLSIFVPLATISHTLELGKQSRRLGVAANSSVSWEEVYRPAAIFTEEATADGGVRRVVVPQDTAQLKYMSNTLALTINEGFRPWVKFGLTAFARLSNAWISNPDTLAHSYLDNKKLQTFFLGGRIDRRSGSGLNFSAFAEIGILGSDKGVVHLEGSLQSRFRLLGQGVALKADALLSNRSASYFINHQHATFGYWDRSLDFIRRLELGGSLLLPDLGLELGARSATINNYLYWSEDAIPTQYSGILQVLMLRASYKGRYGALGWLLDVAHQLSSDQGILPLPLLLARANFWADFRVAQVLHAQIGVDTYWHSAYHAPLWDAPTMQFFNQSQNKIGGKAPLMIAYANFKLQQGRFFIKWFNLAELFLDPDRMSLDRYPYNPPHLEAGIVVDLFN